MGTDKQDMGDLIEASEGQHVHDHPEHPPVPGGYTGAASVSTCTREDSAEIGAYVDRRRSVTTWEGKQIEAPWCGSSISTATHCCEAHAEEWAASDEKRVADAREEGRAASVVGEAVLADAARTQSTRTHALPTDSAERKRTPLCTGLLDYFPAALTAVAEEDNGSTLYPTIDLPEALRDRDLVRLATCALGLLMFELADSQPGDVLPSTHTLADLMRVYAPALASVAQVSWHGNEKHNPGQPLHHARGKSMDHFDCIARHYVERGGFDGPMRHSACLAWRALAALQEDLEAQGAPKARGAK